MKIMTIFFEALFIGMVASFAIACNETKKKEQEPVSEVIHIVDMDQEKRAILKTLNDETAAAFQRDYDAWQSKWVHSPTMTKIYEDLTGGESSTSTGWDEISQFVKDFFEAHPAPEPVPELLSEIDVRIVGTDAHVIYEQQDSLRGRKQEIRTMEKVDGVWKIAGMKTTIYGFDESDH